MEPWNASLSGTDLDYSQEETDKADPVTEDLGGQAGIKGRCSCNLDRAALTMKRYKNKRVCHMCVKCMSQLTKVGNLSTRKALDSCSWKEWASRYAFLKVQSLYELIG